MFLSSKQQSYLRSSTSDDSRARLSSSTLSVRFISQPLPLSHFHHATDRNPQWLHITQFRVSCYATQRVPFRDRTNVFSSQHTHVSNTVMPPPNTPRHLSLPQTKICKNSETESKNSPAAKSPKRSRSTSTTITTSPTTCGPS